MTDQEQQELFEPVQPDIQDVPLDAIQPTPESNGALNSAMHVLGNVSSTLLQRTEDEAYDYRIVDGRRRVAALRQDGKTESVMAYVIDADVDAEADALTLVMNIVREPNPVVEARSIASLIDAGYTPESLSRIGIPRQTVKKRLRLWNAPASIRDGVRDGDIAAGVAEKVANLSPDLQDECAEFYETEGDLRHKDVTEIRQSNKIEEAEAMSPDIFKTPDVDRTETADDVRDEAPENEPGTNVTIPTDADAFEDYIVVAGVVNEHLTTDRYEDVEEALQEAIKRGRRMGLATEEVCTLLRTPPSHFLDEDLLSKAMKTV